MTLEDSVKKRFDAENIVITDIYFEDVVISYLEFMTQRLEEIERRLK